MNVHRNLLRQISFRHGNRHLGDIAYLTGQIAGHGVHAVGQVLPGPSDTRDDRLPTQLAFRADFAGDAGHFRPEAPQLVHHRIDGFFELEDFPAHIGRDLFRQVAVRHRDRHVGNIPHLIGEVARHGIDVFRQVLPGPGDARDGRLPTQLAFRADFPRHPRDFRREGIELTDHFIDGSGGLEEFSFEMMIFRL